MIVAVWTVVAMVPRILVVADLKLALVTIEPAKAGLASAHVHIQAV
jgi:hypothetical protein